MKLVLWIIIAIGVTAIFDARNITKRYFSKQDVNLVVKVMKAMGFLICAVAGIVLSII